MKVLGGFLWNGKELVVFSYAHLQHAVIIVSIVMWQIHCLDGLTEEAM